VPALDFCPLCRSVLPQAAAQCPECGADLRPYTDIAALADRYLKLARELLSRGETERVHHILQQLPQLSGADAGELAEIRARLALRQGEFQAAELALDGCEPAAAAELRAELAQRRRDLGKARELYNHGLAAARAGDYTLAARYLQDATALDPADPNIWVLKLKVDLKCRYFQRCYGDLAALDELAARPPEFYNLEALLPAVAHVRSG
jgi:tetratricopeptide (TPR) repeat protein